MSYANQPINESKWDIIPGTGADEHGNLIVSLTWKGGDENAFNALPKILEWVWDRVLLRRDYTHWPVVQITLSAVHASGAAKKSVDVESLFVPYFVKMLEDMSKPRSDGSVPGFDSSLTQYLLRMPKLRELIAKYKEVLDASNKASVEAREKTIAEFKKKYPCYKEGMSEWEFLPCAFKVGFGETFTFLGDLLGETLNLPKAALETVLPQYLPYIAVGVLALLLLK